MCMWQKHERNVAGKITTLHKHYFDNVQNASEMCLEMRIVSFGGQPKLLKEIQNSMIETAHNFTNC